MISYIIIFHRQIDVKKEPHFCDSLCVSEGSFENGFSAYGLDGEASVLVDHIGSRVAFLGQHHGAGVEVYVAVSELLAFQNVGVSVEEDIAF